jgi:hypothetical protein
MVGANRTIRNAKNSISGNTASIPLLCTNEIYTISSISTGRAGNFLSEEG